MVIKQDYKWGLPVIISKTIIRHRGGDKLLHLCTEKAQIKVQESWPFNLPVYISHLLYTPWNSCIVILTVFLININNTIPNSLLLWINHTIFNCVFFYFYDLILYFYYLYCTVMKSLYIWINHFQLTVLEAKSEESRKTTFK